MPAAAAPPAVAVDSAAETARISREAAHAGIGGRAASGVLAAMSSAVLGRAVGFLAQIVLAWYLTKQDFGIAAVALSASILVTLVRECGVSAMLSRHPRAYARWSADAFWFSLVLASVGMLCLTIATPFIARQAHMPGVVVPTLLLGASWLFATPSTVPLAGMAIDLRFKLGAAVATAFTLFTALLTIALAYIHAGPYAIVVPMLVSAVLRLIIALCISPIALWRRPQLSRWLVMLSYGWPLFVSTVCVTIAMQGDNLILSHFQNETTVGIYYFAYQIVVQLLTLLGQQVGAILLPVFGHIRHDARRQREAFLNAIRLLLAIALPPFFLQAALSEPMLRLVWKEIWVDAALPLSILSIGTGFRLLGTIATPYVWSQGRLREYLWFTTISAVAFIVLVTIGSQFGTTVGVSVAVALFYGLSEPAFAVIALIDRRLGFGKRRAAKDLIGALSVPLAIGIVIFVTTWLPARWLQHALPGRGGPLLATVVGGLWGMALQFGLMWAFRRDVVHDGMRRALSIAPALGRRPFVRKLAGLSAVPA